MMREIFQDIMYLLRLSFAGDVLWLVLPLILATLVMLVYFERYKEERPQWNTYVANSLVLLFVSINLIRYLYYIDGAGFINFINFPVKFGVSLFILFIGIVILFLNFEHFFPEKIAKHIGSPLTLNLIAYIFIVYVYSDIEAHLHIVISLFIIFLVLLLLLNIVRVFFEDLFSNMKKMKDKEELEQVKQDKKPLEERRKQIKLVAKKIKKEEREVNEKEEEIVRDMLKKLDKRKRDAARLKRAVKK